MTLYTYVSELHQSEFAEFTDAVVSGSGLQKELGQTHLLTPKQRTHVDKTRPFHTNREVRSLSYGYLVKLRVNKNPTGPGYVLDGLSDWADE